MGRNIGIIFIFAMLLAIVAMSGCTLIKGNTGAGTPTIRPSSTLGPSPGLATDVPLPSLAPLTGSGNIDVQVTDLGYRLSGSGSPGKLSTGVIHLDKCVYFVTLHYKGLISANIMRGASAGSAVTECMPNGASTKGAETDTQWAYLIKGGDYLVSVNSQHPWWMTIEKPNLSAARNAPATFSGSGIKIAGMVNLEGKKSYTFAVTHSGNTPYTGVIQNAMDGSQVSPYGDLLPGAGGTDSASEGIYCGKTGTYYIFIQDNNEADTWSVTVTPQ